MPPEVAAYGSYRVTTPITVVGSNISLSVFSVLSYTVLSEWRVLGLDVNGAMDYFSNQILLPLGGLLIAVFAGWFISGESTRAELRLDSSASFQLWRFLIRGPVPTAVAIIFVIGVS